MVAPVEEGAFDVRRVLSTPRQRLLAAQDLDSRVLQPSGNTTPAWLPRQRHVNEQKHTRTECSPSGKLEEVLVTL